MSSTTQTQYSSHWKNLALCALLPVGFAVLLLSYIATLYPELTMQSRIGSISISILVLSIMFLLLSRFALRNFFNRPIRLIYEKIILAILFLCSMVAVITTIGIVLSLIFEAFAFFKQIPITDFLFGLEWSPQSAFHYKEKQAGVDFKFGAIPVLFGTFAITIIAVLIAIFFGLSSAIYLSEYASERRRAFLKPMLEILAGIPTVVYGFFAALTVAPIIKDIGTFLGINSSAESALAAGLVMGIMLIPFISSLSDDVFHTIPQSLRDASYAMGATNSETIVLVLLPAAMPGLIGAILLAVSRAIGETMIVVMAAGLAAQINFNPFQAVTTVTVQIVSLLVGDQEFDSPKTLAAFALGLLLFIITLILNIFALHVRKRFTRIYD